MFFKYLRDQFLAACAVLMVAHGLFGQEAHKTTGIEIPPPQTVQPNEGFVKLVAKSAGPVKWLVISSTNVKFDPDDDKKTIVISIPPEPGVTINVFAISATDNKLTEFAQTSIRVAGKPKEVKGETPKGSAAAFHLTYVFDVNDTPRDVAAIVNSKEFSRFVSERQGYFRVYDYTSPVLVQKKLSSLVQKNNNAPTIIIQSPDGQVLNENDLLIPANEKNVIDLINRYLK